MQVYDFMMLFIDERMIETLGNWYPRVMAVMSCVIPLQRCWLLLRFAVSVWALVGVYSNSEREEARTCSAPSSHRR